MAARKRKDPIGKTQKTLSRRVINDQTLATPKGGSVSTPAKSSYKKGISPAQKAGRDAYERAAVEGKKLPTSATNTPGKKITKSNLNKMGRK